MRPSPAPLPANLENELAALIASQFFDDSCPVHAETDLFEAGLDSMALMQLVVLLEEKWGVATPAEDLTTENFRTASALAMLMRRRAGSNP